MFAAIDYNEGLDSERLPASGVPGEVAYAIVQAQCWGDTLPAQNLSSFVTTFTDEHAMKVAKEHMLKNSADRDMYPQIQRMESRMIQWLHRLWNGPQDSEVFGAATVGSSEACMLAGLTAKRNWRDKMAAKGVSDAKSNIILGANVQVAWKKFCCFFEVEARYGYLSPERFCLTAAALDGLVDENTIAVVVTAGQTLTGEDDEFSEIHAWLDSYEKRTGVSVPMHVDAASGGFVHPFVHPEVQWDFRLPRVLSINTSGHKFGLVPPGLGWVIWRDRSVFNEELAFYVNYLGGEELTATLNFSRNSFQIVYQFYNFIRLGFQGYQTVMMTAMENASVLRENLVASGRFRSLGRSIRIPVVTVALVDSSRFSVYDISDRLRLRGWVASSYTMPPHAEEVACLRIVVRPHLNRAVVMELSETIFTVCEQLDKSGGSAEPPDLHNFDLVSQKV